MLVLLLSPDRLAAFPSFLSSFRPSDRWCSRPFLGRWLAPFATSGLPIFPPPFAPFHIQFLLAPLACNLPGEFGAFGPNCAPEKQTNLHALHPHDPTRGGCSWCWWIPLPLLARTHHRSNRTEHSRVLGAELVAALCPRSEDMGSCPPIWKAPLGSRCRQVLLSGRLHVRRGNECCRRHGS